MTKGLIILGVFFILSWCWIAYAIWTAPLMPDDFELKDEDIWPLDEHLIDEPEYDAAIDRHKPEDTEESHSDHLYEEPNLSRIKESAEEWDEDHALDLVMNDMVKDFTEKDIQNITNANKKD